MAELVDFRDAARSLGTDQMTEFAPFPVAPEDLYTFDGLAAAAEKYATKIAVESSIVWPGLTALVTLESNECADLLNNLEVCHGGDGYGDGNENGDQAGDLNSWSGSGRSFNTVLCLLCSALSLGSTLIFVL